MILIAPITHQQDSEYGKTRNEQPQNQIKNTRTTALEWYSVV